MCSPRSRAATGSRPTSPAELVPQLRLDDAECERPQLLDRSAKARLVVQAARPQLGVQPVVDLLAVDLRRQPGELGIVAGAQSVKAEPVGLLVEVAARDRVRPVEQTQLDERRAAVRLGVAVEREGVRIGVKLDRGELVKRPGVADLVLGDRRKGDVLLERRRDPGPLRVPPPEDQLVVSQAQKQLCPLVHVPPSAVP